MVDAAGSVNSSAPALDIMRRRIDEADSRQAAESVSTNAPAGTPVPAPATVVVPAAPVSAEGAPASAASSTPPAAASAPSAASPSDAASAPAGDQVVSALTLRAVRKAQPEYPLPALDRMVSGWVDMEFTVA
jgi:hypothetical protein